jgi:outer membrane protein, heavy metal efflux system
MSSRARLQAWLAVATLMAPASVDAQARAAQDLVDAIVREGPRAIAIRAEVEVVRRDQAARQTFPNPAIAYSREGAGFTEFFQAEQALPIFGLRRALVRVGVAATAAAEAERDARLWDLRVDATRLVARWASAQERAATAAADVEAVARLVEILRVREREGEGSRFDRLRTEQELASLRHAAVAADVALSDARASVSALLPADVTATSVSLPSRTVAAPIDSATLWTRAQTTRSDLRALASSAEHATPEAEAARRVRRPSPTVSAGLKRSDTGSRRELGSVVGIGLALPLFDAGSRDAARWTAEGSRIAAERAALEREIRADVQRAAEALARRRQALMAESSDALATELVQAAEVAYREGEIGVADLLDAVRTASLARLRDLERRLEVRLAEVALERAVGDVLWP